MYINSSKVKCFVAIFLLGFMQFSLAKNKQDTSLEQASETIRKESKGQVLSATTNRYNGVTSHRIQVLTESGRVKVYQVPAFKKDIPKHYGNSNPRNNKPRNNNQRNNNSKDSTNQSQYSNRYQNDTTTRNSSQSRSHYSRNSSSSNHSNQSSGGSKKK